MIDASRKTCSKIFPFLFCFYRPVIDQNLYYAGLKFTSPTYSCAISNMLPAMTFVMAAIFRYISTQYQWILTLFICYKLITIFLLLTWHVFFLCLGWIRMEKVDIRKLRCQAKVIGTIVTVAGAMLMTLYKGQVISFLGSQYMHHPRNYVPENTTGSGEKDWFKGSILLIIATLAWASFFILQASNQTQTVGGKYLTYFFDSYSCDWLVLHYATVNAGSNTKKIPCSALSHSTCVCLGYTAINCSYLCHGAQAICLDHWLGYEPSCSSLCCKSQFMSLAQ